MQTSQTYERNLIAANVGELNGGNNMNNSIGFYKKCKCYRPKGRRKYQLFWETLPKDLTGIVKSIVD